MWLYQSETKQENETRKQCEALSEVSNVPLEVCVVSDAEPGHRGQ